MRITVPHLQSLKQEQKKFSVLTAYDACFAHWIEQAGIEVILVGDSLGMVLQGNASTLPVTIDHMVYHTACVSKGTTNTLIMADMPFMSGIELQPTIQGATKLMQAGAHCVKLEGGSWLAPCIEALNHGGIPVCAHIGLTPQSVHKFGGYKVQGRSEQAADDLIQTAKSLESAGADFILLECVPTPLAKKITEMLSVPVIGIGAGAHCDAQVLVLHDMLGLNPHRTARFVQNFMENQPDIQSALRAYAHAVKAGLFPTSTHGFDA